MLRGEKDSREKSLRNWKRVNRVVIFLYETGLLPLFGVGWFILLLYTRGRRTGRIRVTPLEYRRRGGFIILFSARGLGSDWYRNLRANPYEVKLRIGFKTFKPGVELVDKPDEVRIT